MEKITKYGIIALLLLLVVSMGSCMDPISLLVAANNADIYYSGVYNSNGTGDAILEVRNTINSNIYSIYSIFNGGANTSDDLLGTYCIGAGNTNIIHGVPTYLSNVEVHFADNNTNTATFNGINFATYDYVLTIDIDTNIGNVATIRPNIVPGPTASPSLNSAQTLSDGTQQIIKDGVRLTLKAVPR